MATVTKYYGFKKPDYVDSADISVLNENMDAIDAKMKEIENKAISGGGGGSSVSYSTEEQVVGAWIDGKPLYQKTIVTNSPSTSATIFLTMDSNVDIQSIECKLNESESYRFNVPFYVESQTFASIYIRNRYEIEWVSSNQYFNKECIVTVRYTKTTD